MQALKRHSVGVAFLASVRHKFAAVTKNATAEKPYLPVLLLRCSIRVAYQAADAGHPGYG